MTVGPHASRVGHCGRQSARETEVGHLALGHLALGHHTVGLDLLADVRTGRLDGLLKKLDCHLLHSSANRVEFSLATHGGVTEGRRSAVPNGVAHEHDGRQGSRS